MTLTLKLNKIILAGERSPMGPQSGFGPPLGAPGSAQRTQSYRVTPSADREQIPYPRPRSFTPQPSDLDSRSGEEYGYTMYVYAGF